MRRSLELRIFNFLQNYLTTSTICRSERTAFIVFLEKSKVWIPLQTIIYYIAGWLTGMGGGSIIYLCRHFRTVLHESCTIHILEESFNLIFEAAFNVPFWLLSTSCFFLRNNFFPLFKHILSSTYSTGKVSYYRYLT